MDAETRAALELAVQSGESWADSAEQIARLQALLDEKGGGARSTDGTGGETPVTTTGAETLGSHREQAAREGAHVQGEKRKPGSTPPDSAAKIAADMREYVGPQAPLMPGFFWDLLGYAARVEALGHTECPDCNAQVPTKILPDCDCRAALAPIAEKGAGT